MNRIGRLLADSARCLARNRLRTLFMLPGPFIGVAALTILVALGQGTQQDVLDRIDRMLSGSTILLRAGGTQVRGLPDAVSGPTTTLTLRDLAIIDSTLSAVELVDPVLMARRGVTYDGRSVETLVEGHAETAEIVWSRSVTSGVFLGRDDVASAARVALVGRALVDRLFDGRDPVGEQIRIAGSPFRVIGVLEAGGTDPHGIDRDDVVMIPISTMMRRVANVDWVSHAKLTLTPGTDLDMAVLEIGDILRREHAIGPDEPADFAMFTPLEVRQRVRETNRTFTLFLPLMASISIVVGGIVVANLMLLAVTERRSEIGLRKAVGARERDIRFHFMAESAAVTALGGLAAVIAAAGVIAVLSSAGRPTSMPWSAAGLGMAVSVGVGLIAGVAPARRASALDPVLTLR